MSKFTNFKDWWLSDESPRRHMSEVGAHFVMDHCREAWNAGVKSKLPPHPFDGSYCERCNGPCKKTHKIGVRGPHEATIPFEL